MLDELAFLAAQIREAPISLISLVDEARQWSRSDAASRCPRRVVTTVPPSRAKGFTDSAAAA